MGLKTSIGWTDSTFNFVWGCTKVSDGCKNCYMYRYSERIGRDPYKVEYTKQGMSGDILKKLDALGEKVFINSMSDTFHDTIPDQAIITWFDLLASLPNHQFIVLTKRVRRMQTFWPVYCLWRSGNSLPIPKNIWLGCSIENDESCHHRLFQMHYLDAPIKFVSFEPLLAPIDIPRLYRTQSLKGIDWIIIGGESGDDPRSMNPGWAQELIDFTRANYPDCAIFFKQMGGRGRDGAGGDVLNGKQYHEFPKYK